MDELEEHLKDQREEQMIIRLNQQTSDQQQQDRDSCQTCGAGCGGGANNTAYDSLWSIRQIHGGNGSCHCYHVDKLMEEMGQAKDSISKLEKSKGS